MDPYASISLSVFFADMLSRLHALQIAQRWQWGPQPSASDTVDGATGA